jgi:hypothetical protein
MHAAPDDFYCRPSTRSSRCMQSIDNADGSYPKFLLKKISKSPRFLLLRAAVFYKHFTFKFIRRNFFTQIVLSQYYFYLHLFVLFF